MALTLNWISGAETGGLDEVASIFNTPSVDDIASRTGTFAFNCTNSADRFGFNPFSVGIAAADNNLIIGFAFRPKIADPNRVNSSMIRIGSSLGTFLSVGHNTNGDWEVRDASANLVGSAFTPGFTDATYSFIEVYVQHSDPGDIEVFVDGNSKFSASSQDFTNGGNLDNTAVFSFGGNDDDNTADEEVRYDDIYVLSGATAASDRYGDFAVKAFQSAHATNDDIGDPLADGEWDLVGETPLNEGTSNDAQYQDTGSLTGSTVCDDGARAGPSGDGDITGVTIKGAKFVGRFKRGTGGGRVHSFLHGNDVDGVTASADLGLETAYATKEIVSESASIVPLSTESFQYGFSKDATAGQDIFCGDIWAMLGYVPAAGEIPIINLVMAPYVPATR